MKDGVYQNLFKGKSNLVLVENGKFIDGEAVAFKDYDVTFKIDDKKMIMRFTFKQLQYLGKL